MKFNYLKACLISMAVGAWSTAFSAPPFGGSPITKYDTMKDYAQGDACQGACSGFSVERHDADGVLTGLVYIYYVAGTTIALVHCEGPEFANSIAVNPGTGATTINVTVNPYASNCTLTGNITLPATLTLSVTGTPDGTYSSTSNGTGKTEFFSGTTHFHYTNVIIAEAFTGTNGFITGVMTGQVQTSRNTDITKQVK